MSSSVTNDTQSIEDSGNATASLIDSAELSEGIKKAAEKNGLQINTEAASILASLDTSDTETMAAAIASMEVNIKHLDDDYIQTITPDTIVYDSEWQTLTKVTGGDLAYTTNNDVFDASSPPQARSKVYVNFKKGEMSGDMFTRITLKGESQISHSWNTGTAGITSVPIVASTVRGLKSDGTTDFDEFVDINPSMKAAADTLAPQYEIGKTKQELMDWYNHSSDTEADKRLFFYGKFTTVGDAGSPGTGTIIIEGAAHANPDATNATTTASYIATIERLEGSATIEGKALD